jgi:CheY-like chemotaxis protein
MEYQNEIIAGGALILSLLIYLFVKKSNPKKEIIDVENIASEKKELKQIIVEEPQTKLNPYDTKQNEDEECLLGSEEGDFGIDDNEKKEDTKETSSKKRTITKRDVPQHGKITKQNFSEFAGKRILVAEDNLINQKVLTGLLAGSGIEVVIANDGQEALDILQNDDNFLMILMDAHMPRVDGFEATRQIRKNPRYDHILVVALSGDTGADDIQKMKDAGMSEQLEKPLRMESFYDILYAYSGEQKEDEEYIEVIMTKELNGDRGLEVCGGDDIFYREILQEFLNNYSDSSEKLEDLLNNSQIEQADKLLLDIIGVSANIGAKQLEQVAMDIKEALKDQEEKSYLTLLDMYRSHLRELIKDIKDYLSI